MKYIRQIAIIFAFSLAGEVLHTLLPWPIPSSVYGLVLLFAALCAHVVRVSDIRESGHLLLEVMPIFFIPPAVGLIGCWEMLRPVWLPFCVIILVSSLTVFGAAGWVTQWLLPKENRKNE